MYVFKQLEGVPEGRLSLLLQSLPDIHTTLTPCPSYFIFSQYLQMIPGIISEHILHVKLDAPWSKDE